MTLFHDTIQAAGAVTALVANRVDLGDITLPTGDWVITRVWADAVSVGTWTASEGTFGYIQIESQDCGIAPLQFLLEPRGAGIGTGGNTAGSVEPRKWIINCPARGGTILNIYHVADATISTALSEVLVTIEFSQGSPFGGGQIHMKCGEPSVTGATGDGDITELTDIEIKASVLHAVAVYVGAPVSVNDASVFLMMEIKSDDFAEQGRQRFSLGGPAGGEQTNHPVGLNPIRLIELDAPFRSAGQKQVVAAEYTAYDAVSTGPEVNWCLIYS